MLYLLELRNKERKFHVSTLHLLQIGILVFLISTLTLAGIRKVRELSRVEFLKVVHTRKYESRVAKAPIAALSDGSITL